MMLNNLIKMRDKLKTNKKGRQTLKKNHLVENLSWGWLSSLRFNHYLSKQTKYINANVACRNKYLYNAANKGI
jgi:hypothetical protein